MIMDKARELPKIQNVAILLLTLSSQIISSVLAERRVWKNAFFNVELFGK